MMSDSHHILTVIARLVGGSEEDEPPLPKPSERMLESFETKMTQLSSSLQILQTELQVLKSDFMACNDIMVNRETCFRDAIDQRMEVLKAAVSHRKNNDSNYQSSQSFSALRWIANRFTKRVVFVIIVL